jgi:hypothetical protein
VAGTKLYIGKISLTVYVTPTNIALWSPFFIPFVLITMQIAPPAFPFL